MTVDEARQIIKECRDEISFMATQPYGYEDVALLEKRIAELTDFINNQQKPTVLCEGYVRWDVQDSGVESFA